MMILMGASTTLPPPPNVEGLGCCVRGRWHDICHGNGHGDPVGANPCTPPPRDCIPPRVLLNNSASPEGGGCVSDPPPPTP